MSKGLNFKVASLFGQILLLSVSVILLFISHSYAYAGSDTKSYLGAFPSTFYQRESATTLYLNGLGISNGFSRRAYVAGIYLPSPTSQVTEALNKNTPKRISLYFVHEKPNLRDFFSDWLEAYCQTQKDCGDGLEAGLQTLRQLLYRGQPQEKAIHIDYLPQLNRLNVASGKTRLGSIPHPEVFYFLLNSWLGDHPPSQQFKEELLAGIPQLAN